jgi:glycosyltransferase involved in cell wall biosynthesis
VDLYNEHMAEPLFSVILPTYNRARMAVAAVLSVLGQTESDWELLVVDDGSTDNTLELLGRLPQDPRVRIIARQENRGQHVCRNFAIGESRGKFITFLDSDDLYLPERLATFKMAAQNRPEIGFWFSNAVQRRDGVIIDYLFTPEREIPEGQVPGHYAVGDEYLPYVTTNIAVERGAFDKFGRYREDLKILEDTELYVRMLAGGLKVGVIRQPLSVRTLHAGQITGDYHKDFEEALIALKAGDPAPEVFARKRRKLAIEVATYMFKNVQPDQARELLREELGDDATSHPLYRLCLTPRPLLSAARTARQAWLHVRYARPFAPAAFVRSETAIGPYLEQAAKL